MDVYGVQIPNKPLTNFELLDYSKKLNLHDLRGVFMRDTLPTTPHWRECGIVNFNTSSEPGSHWVCYFKNGQDRIYFDSYGQITLDEVQKYLKTPSEIDKQVIKRISILSRVQTLTMLVPLPLLFKIQIVSINLQEVGWSLKGRWSQQRQIIQPIL